MSRRLIYGDAKKFLSQEKALGDMWHFPKWPAQCITQCICNTYIYVYVCVCVCIYVYLLNKCVPVEPKYYTILNKQLCLKVSLNI